jgi:hypothetical protein
MYVVVVCVDVEHLAFSVSVSLSQCIVSLSLPHSELDGISAMVPGPIELTNVSFFGQRVRTIMNNIGIKGVPLALQIVEEYQFPLR